MANMMIESLGVALPDTFRSARDLVAGCKLPLQFNMEAVTGIIETPSLPEGQFARDLAERAIENCLAVSRRKPEEIDLLISGTLVNCNEPGAISLEAPMSSVHKQHFGFTRALALDVSSACAGLFVGLRIARAFLTAGAARRALVYTGEYVTHGVPIAQGQIESANDPRLPCLTVGDSGAAMLLELGEDPELGFIDFQLYTLGRYSGHCVAKPTEQSPGGIVMRTDTVRLALITSREGIQHFERLRRAKDFKPTHFDFFVPHQASAATLSGVIRDANKRLGPGTLTDANVVNNLAHRGNTVTTTHFLAIHDAIREGRMKDGHKLLLSTVASGATIGSAVYHLDDLPSRIRAAEGAPRAPRPEPDARVTAWARPLAFPARVESLAVVVPDAGVRVKTLALAKDAARQCLAQSAIKRDEIELLIFAGVYKSEFIVEPALAAFLTGELRINDASGDTEIRTLAFDLGDSSNGFLSACHVAARAIECGEIRSALVVVAEGDVPLAAGSPGVPPCAAAAILGASRDGDGFTSFGSYDFPSLFGALRSDVVIRKQGGAELRRSVSPELRSLYAHSVSQSLELFLEAQPEQRERVTHLVLPDVEPELARALPDRLKLARGCEVLSAAPERELFSAALPQQLKRLDPSAGGGRGRHALLVSAGAGVKVVCASYAL